MSIQEGKNRLEEDANDDGPPAVCKDKLCFAGLLDHAPVGDSSSTTSMASVAATQPVALSEGLSGFSCVGHGNTPKECSDCSGRADAAFGVVSEAVTDAGLISEVEDGSTSSPIDIGSALRPIDTEAPNLIESPPPSDKQESSVERDRVPPAVAVTITDSSVCHGTVNNASAPSKQVSRKRGRTKKGTSQSEVFLRSCKEPEAPYTLLVRPKNTPREISTAPIIGEPSFEGMGASLHAAVKPLPRHVIDFLKSKGPTKSRKFDTVFQYNKSRNLKHFVVEEPLDGPIGKEFHSLLVEMTTTCLGESHPAIQRLCADSLSASSEHLSFTRTSQETGLKFLYSMLLSTETSPQHSHRDYTDELLNNLAPDQAVLIAFFALTEAGTWLQLWDDKGVGSLVFCPWGRILVLPGNTVHGGGFKSHPNGNLRGHLYLFVNTTPLTKNDLITNYEANFEYEPADSIRDLCPFYR